MSKKRKYIDTEILDFLQKSYRQEKLYWESCLQMEYYWKRLEIA